MNFFVARDTIAKLISDKKFTFATLSYLKWTASLRVLCNISEKIFFLCSKTFSSHNFFSPCTNAWKTREKWHVYVHTRRKIIFTFFSLVFVYHAHPFITSIRHFPRDFSRLFSLRTFFSALLVVYQQVAVSTLQWAFVLSLQLSSKLRETKLTIVNNSCRIMLTKVSSFHFFWNMKF